MADENPPITGKGAEAFERAAAGLARSANQVEKAAGKTRKVAEGAEEAGRRLRATAARIERSFKVQTTDRGRFYVEEDRGPRSGAGTSRYDYALRQGRQRPSFFATREAAEREKQAIAYQRALIAEAGAVERTEERKTKAVQQGERKRQAAIRTRPIRVPPPRELTAEQQDLMREYVRAQQQGQQRAARDLRKRLVDQKILGEAAIGGWGQRGIPIPGPATKPSMGTDAFAKQFEAALRSPNFTFTPDPDRLAREMARLAGGVDVFPDELRKLADARSKGERTARQKQEAQLREFMRPHAEQSLAALPADIRSNLERQARDLIAAREALAQAQRGPGGASKPGQFTAVQAAETKLLNAAREAQGLAAAATPPGPKITYNPAFLREQEQKRADAERARAEAERIGARDAAERAERAARPPSARIVRRREDIEADIARQRQIVDLRQASASPARRPERTQAGRELARFQQELAEFDRGAQAVEKAEERKTKAVQEGTKKRKAAQADETRAVSGNAAEFERVAADRAAEARRQVEQHHAYQERVRAGTAPALSSAEFDRQRAEELARARVIEKPSPAPAAPKPAIQSTPELTAEEKAAAADRRVARERERAEADKLARARANDLAATDAAAKAKLEEAERTRQNARLSTGLTNLLNQKRSEAARLAANAPGTDVELYRNYRDRFDVVGEQRRRSQPGPYFGQAGVRTQVGPTGSGIVDRQFTIDRNRTGRAERTAYRADARAAAAFAEGERKAADYAQTIDDTRKRAAALGGEEGRLAQRLERTSIAADLSSQRFRKHGALTTEFIEAAARGQVTMRELGYQITATIGKFAGWTAAATAVYAVAGAMAQLGRGAIDSASGVERVHRVVDEVGEPGGAERVQRGFRDLSERFNVPISDTVDATYGAGKVFNDLDGALKGAAVSLFAMKVGELDAAAAQESLTAIVRGFRLEADDLPAVFDNINEAQNRFGGNVGQLTQGVARAAGQFTSAGGNYRELIALLTAGSRLTGAPATEVATAIGRSVSVVRTAAGAARARRAGLDPTQDPLALIQQAQQLAKGASPERVQELARSIIPSGGQFARIFVPLIENAELLNKVLDKTDPEKTKGSAQRELAKALREPVEQISALVNGLQRLGAVAVESGFLTPFALLLKTLNTTIGVAEDLFGIFDRVVPDPLQPILATALQIYGVVRLLRRFPDVGAALPAGSAAQRFLSRSPAQLERTQVLQGLGATTKFLTGTRERVGQEAAAAAFREQQAARRFQLAASTGDDALILRRQRQFDQAAERAADLAEEEGDLRRQINDTDARRNTFTRRIKQGANVGEASAAAGLTYRTASFDRPTTAGPERITTERGGTTPGGLILPAGVAAGGLRSAAHGIETTEFETRRTAAAAATFRERSKSMGVSGRALGAAATGAAAAAGAAGAGLRAAGGGLARVGGSLLAALGPLDFAILGIVGTFLAIDKIKASAAAEKAKIDKAVRTRDTGDPTRIRESVEDFNVSRNRAYVSGGRAGGGFIPTRGPVEGGPEGLARAESERLADELEREQARGRLLTLDQVNAQLRTAQGVALGEAEQRAALRTAIRRLRQGYALNRLGGGEQNDKIRAAVRERIDALNAKLTSLGSLGSDIDQALRDAQDLDALGTIVEGQGALIELRGRGPGVRRARNAIGAAAIRASEIYARDQDPAAYLKALQDQESEILGPAEDRLERLLAVTRSPAARTRVRRRFIGNVRRGFGLADDQAQLRLDTIANSTAQREQQIAELERQRSGLADEPGVNVLGAGVLGGLPGSGNRAEIAKIDSEITALKQRIANGNRNRRALVQGIKYRERRLAEIARDIRQQEFQEATELFGARTALYAGRTTAGLPRIRLQIQRAGQAVARLVRNKMASQADIVAALEAQDALIAQEVQEQASLILSRANLRTGGATGAGLEEFLAFQRAHPRVYSEEDTNQTKIQIRDAAKQRAEEAKAKAEEERRKAEELLDAQFEFKSSLTDNPVELARLQARHDQKVVDRGGFANQAEKLRALAARNNSRRAKENAIADRRLENAEYAHDIGKLSDQQYINRLQAIQKTYEKGSEGYRRLKQQIGRFKHNLEDSTELELTPGNIKLPTLTEIRKFINGRANEQGPTPTVPIVIGGHRQPDSAAGATKTINHNRIVLHISKGSEDKVFDALEAAGLRVKTKARSRRPG